MTFSYLILLLVVCVSGFAAPLRGSGNFVLGLFNHIEDSAGNRLESVRIGIEPRPRNNPLHRPCHQPIHIHRLPRQ